jgi:molecular chaperone GrpE (heat shock protein)
MKRLIGLAVFLVAIAGAAEDSPLVKAAKANGGPKKKTTKKVITNADVKKSSVKGTTPRPAAKPVPKTASVAAPTQSIADQDKLLRARAEAKKRSDAAQAKVNDLDKELDRLEQAYYAENDPNYRDKTITERFEQTKQQLESARKDLADARDSLEKLTPKGH